MSEEWLHEVYDEAKIRMDKCIVSFANELSKVRTGRASLTLLDGVNVDYYGNLTPLKQMATLGVPEARLITVTPWDVSQIEAIDKAIRAADLGVNPINDGKLIRLPIPSLNEERRKEMVKQVKKVSEESKVAVRNVRRDSNEELKKLEKDSEITEDEMHKGMDKVQKIHDDFIQKVTDISETKQTELMEV
jgi:ribosome recycling factor